MLLLNSFHCLLKAGQYPRGCEGITEVLTWHPKNHAHTTQCCIFNNFSIVKHRHQFWDWISISVFKVEITKWPWISPQFTSIIRKLALVFFFDEFCVSWKKIFSSLLFQKKSLFIYIKNLSESTLLFQNFKSYIFDFLIFFLITSFHSVLLHLSFFLMKKIFFVCCQIFFFFFLSNLGNFANLLRPKFWSEWRPVR